MSSQQQELDEAFLREARIGLMVLTVLVAIFFYVAFGKLSGWNSPEPVAFQSPSETNSTAGSSSPNNLADNIQPVRVPANLDDSAHSTPATPTKPVEISDPSLDGPFVPGEPITQTPNLNPPERPQTNLEPPRFTRNTTPLSPFTPPANRSTGPLRQPLAGPASKVDSISQDQSESGDKGFQPPMSFAASASSNPPQVRSRFKLPKLRQSSSPSRFPAKPTRNTGVETGPPVKTASATEAIESPRKSSLLVPPTGTSGDTRVEESTQGPKTNEPSLALGQLEGATPLPDSPGTAVAEQGEGFWLVAQRVYGDGRYFDALYQANKKRVASFNEVPAGTELETPPVDVLRQRWPYLCPREEIKTSGGETLFELASDHLGQASRYIELLKLNYSRLPKGVTQDTPLPADVALELPRYR